MIKAKDLFNIEGKIALVTGSTGGLGSVFAKGLAENGCTVILNSRSAEKLQKQLEEFRENGYPVDGYIFDVSNTSAIKKAVQEIENKHGKIDILINNAGINLRAPLEELDENNWQKVIDVNLTGTFKISQAVAQSMIRNKHGKIINIASMQSELARPTIAAYTASKGGIKMLTKAMATEWARFNIQVNAIGPGYFKTNMTRPLYENPEFDSWLCQRVPSNRWGNAEELIGTLLLLASPAGNYINGQTIYVDGGLLSTV